MIFGVCVIFLFFFSISTSPLTSNSYCSDSAFFQMVGQSMVRGRFIYRDIFDNKGPFLYLIQYLGQILSYGRYGIFIIQLLNLWFTLFLVDQICQMVCERNSFRFRFFSMGVFLFILGVTLDGGNLSEEYSLPVLFVCLYLFFWFLYHNKIKGFSISIVFGASFSFLAFIRLTNASFICVLIAVVLVELIRNRQLKTIFLCAIGFITGFLGISFFICVYSDYKGVLSDMLYATFVFNYFYGTNTTGIIRYDVICVLFVITLISVWINRKESTYIIFSLFSIIGTVGILLLGHAYIHYYQLIIPPTLANMWLIMRKYDMIQMRYKRVCVCMVCLFMVLMNSNMLIYQCARAVFALGMNTPEREGSVLGDLAHIIERKYAPDWWEHYGYKAAERVADILEQIPEEDYDKVYNYNTKPYWLRTSGLLPYGKYCQTQESFIFVNPEIRDEIDEMFQLEPPLYVVIEDYENIYNDKIIERLNEQYYVKHKNEIYMLYGRIDN